jgi:hypothetical protein
VTVGVSPIAAPIGNVIDRPWRYAGHLADGFVIEAEVGHGLNENGNVGISAFRHESLFIFSRPEPGSHQRRWARGLCPCAPNLAAACVGIQPATVTAIKAMFPRRLDQQLSQRAN